MHSSGLLFYNGRLNEKHDFLALELVTGQVRLTYSTGVHVVEWEWVWVQGLGEADSQTPWVCLPSCLPTNPEALTPQGNFLRSICSLPWKWYVLLAGQTTLG